MKILDIPRSGSVAGITSSHNRAGQYVRNRRTPTNSPTARRTTIRTAMAAASSGYSALTAAQQASFVAAADSHPVTDALGQSIKLTGHQLYVSVAVALLNVGQPRPTSPPSTFAVYSASDAAATFSVASGLSVTPPSAGTTADFLLIALSRPLPSGRTFWKTFTQVHGAAWASTPFVLTTAAYAAQFGSPVAGNKIFVRITPVSAAGVTGVSVVLPVVVT